MCESDHGVFGEGKFMSILDKSSLVMIPSGYKEDKLYSVKPRNGDGDFTFTRASTGTRVNADGYIEDVAWNLIQYSEDFSQSSWSKVGSSVVSGFPSPNGLTNAYKLVEDTSSGAHYLAFVNISVKSGSYYTSSAFFKKGESNFIQLLFSSSSHAGNNHANFDLQNGVVGSVSDGVAEIESVGEYYRCSYTSQATASTTTNVFFWKVQSATSSRAESYSGDGTSGVYVWGAQAVKGNEPKTYIKTTDRLDIPRLDYSGGATNPTLLLEPQRTNLVTYSEQLDNAWWQKANATINSNNIVSPDGTQNADALVDDTTYGVHRVNTNNINITSGNIYAFSGFVKSGSIDFLHISGASGQFGNNTTVINMSNGTLVSKEHNNPVSIIDYGNGWYRFEFFLTAISSSLYSKQYYNPSSSSTSPFYTGTNEISCYMWGMQVEQGSFPTSYIPTNGTSVTRNDESFVADSLGAIIGQTEGCVFIDFVYYEGNRFEIFDASSTADGFLIYRSGTTYNLQVGNGGTYWAITNFITGLTIGTQYKLAINYKLNDYKVYVNGSQTATNTSIEVPTTNKIISSQSNGANKFTNHINEFMMFDQFLTDDELEALTTL